MYAVWITNSTIEGKKWTNGSSSWAGGADSIGSGKSGVSFNFSLTSDTSNNLHLIYIEPSGYVHYKKYASGSWDVSATRLDNATGGQYISISVNSSNNDIYALYVRNDVVYYNQFNGSWVGETDTNWNEGTSAFGLVTNYQGNGFIFGEWTSGVGNPYIVNSAVVVPENIWLMMGFIPLISFFSKKKRKALAQLKLKC